MLLLWLACKPEPCVSKVSSYVPPHEGWTPILEEENRYSLGDLIWTADVGTVDPASTACGATPCVAIQGTATTSLILNRAVPYHLSMRISGGGATVTMTQIVNDGDKPTLFSQDVAAGSSVPLEMDVEMERPGVEAKLQIASKQESRVESLQVVGTQWADVGVSAPAAPVQLAVLIHVEESPHFKSDEVVWRRAAQVLAGLSGILHAHHAGLNIQADATFFDGVDVWSPNWVEDRLAEGATFSAHFHGDDEADFEKSLKEARKTLKAYGVTLRDMNGGFDVGTWKVAAEQGYCSLTAFKDLDDQGSLPLVFSSPWRPPDHSGVEDVEGFLTHDPAGPLIYLPGMEGREADHRRWPAWAGRVLSQVVSHATVGAVNQWYFVSHSDAFGPVEDDDFQVYVDNGGLAADLANYDDFLTQVTDPLVESGDLIYSSPDAMAQAYLDAEK